MPIRFTKEQIAAEPDENARIVMQIHEAEMEGDEALGDELRKRLVIPAGALMATKRVLGAEWIRQQGWRTETAEARYGKDWLDQ